MKDFKNWRYIASKGCYRYAISSNVAYEIFIEYWDHNTPIETLKASLCRAKTSPCLVDYWYLTTKSQGIVPNWHHNNKVTMTEREWLGEELPIPELLEIAYKDNKLIKKITKFL